MKKTKKAILFGTSGQAEVMDYLLTLDSEYEVVALQQLKIILKKMKFIINFIAFENIEKSFLPSDFEMHIAIGYNDRNKPVKNFIDWQKQRV